MAINISKNLDIRYELISKSIEDIERKLLLLPEGRVNVREINGKAYYYLATDIGKDKYLSTDDPLLIEQLLQKDYLKKVLRVARRELKAIEKMQKLYPEMLPENVYAQLPQGRKTYTRPVVSGDDSFAQKWMETPYKHKAFKKGTPEFYTLKNERVRSKSEVIIADRLREKGIPYRYECPLKVGNKIIHPDFTILRMSDRKIVYHEHCGKIGDREYAEDMLTRAKDYSQADIILGDRLFYSFESETTPLDIMMLDKLIDTHFR